MIGSKVAEVASVGYPDGFEAALKPLPGPVIVMGPFQRERRD
jgi:hypothetical protein